jgi:hypothetical protein
MKKVIFILGLLLFISGCGNKDLIQSQEAVLTDEFLGILSKAELQEIENKGVKIPDFERRNIEKIFTIYYAENSGHTTTEEEIYLYVTAYEDEFINAKVLFTGRDNYKASSILATKVLGQWQIVDYGTDYSTCRRIEEHNFPISMVTKCWFEGNLTERE